MCEMSQDLIEKLGAFAIAQKQMGLNAAHVFSIRGNSMVQVSTKA